MPDVFEVKKVTIAVAQSLSAEIIKMGDQRIAGVLVPAGSTADTLTLSFVGVFDEGSFELGGSGNTVVLAAGKYVPVPVGLSDNLDAFRAKVSANIATTPATLYFVIAGKTEKYSS